MELDNCSGVYTLTAPSGHQYVGSTKNFRIRKRQHFSELHRGIHGNAALQNAYNKYQDKLIFAPLFVCSESNLLFYEQLVLDKYKPEYNISKIAGVPPNKKGRPHSSAHREALSKALIGNQRWLGKKHTPETLKKMSLAASNRRKINGHWVKSD